MVIWIIKEHYLVPTTWNENQTWPPKSSSTLQQQPQQVSLSRFKLFRDIFIKLVEGEKKRGVCEQLTVVIYFIYIVNFIKLFLANDVSILLLKYHSCVLMGNLIPKIYICFLKRNSDLGKVFILTPFTQQPWKFQKGYKETFTSFYSSGILQFVSSHLCLKYSTFYCALGHNNTHGNTVFQPLMVCFCFRKITT